MRIKVLLRLIVLFFPTLALAAPESSPTQSQYSAYGQYYQYDPRPQMSQTCVVTPSMEKPVAYPGRKAIVPSNNLAKPEGKAVYARGQKIYLFGRVLDKNCVPISDALVEIWQPNPYGKHVVSDLNDRLSPFPDFVGSGQAITDNLGKFSFITLFPGQDSMHAPHINFRVTRENFPDTNSAMFFARDARNEKDSVLKKLSPETRNLLLGRIFQVSVENDVVYVNWDIVMNGVNPYRKY